MIRQVLKSKVAKNGAWLYLLQFFNTICPLLTIPYIVRVLDSTSYGVFSLALNLVSYFQVLVEYGFGMSATRKVALDDPETEINRIFSNILSARSLLLTACFILTVTLTNILHIDPTQRKCIYVLLISLLGYTLQVNWLFQGKQEMKFISVANIISRVSTLVLIFVFVRSSDDLYVYCFLYAIAPVISSSIGIVLATRKYKLRFIWTELSAVKNEFKEGWYVFTTSLSSKVFGAIGITLLGIYATESVVGIYSAIHKIPNIIVLGWAPISQILYPVTSKKISADFASGYRFVKRLRLMILPVFVFIAVLVTMFQEKLLKLHLVLNMRSFTIGYGHSCYGFLLR